METRPLLTFALFAYRQERYVREAVQSALAQTYTPLQIILSDDCSPDDTFKIMQEEAAAYQGPHEVIVNRMPKNVGVGRHINHVMELSKGELVVAAAGDDISMPERTSECFRQWEAAGKKADSLYSAILLIDEEGDEIGPFTNPEQSYEDVLEHCRKGLVVTGCSHAWTSRVFESFGPLREDLIYEDRALALRSRLRGGIQFIPQMLVKYRRSSGSLTAVMDNRFPAAARRREAALHARRMLGVYRQWEDDFRKATNAPRGWEKVIEEVRMVVEITLTMLEGGFFARFGAFLGGIKAGLSWKWLWRTYAMYASRTLFWLWVRWNPNMRQSGWQRQVDKMKAQRKTTTVEELSKSQ